ncbi:MAG TPA: hypothetical protein PL157_17665, partial [Acidobacteriota bacterium]|nr:hypothetical protein [Acidobacteriota bacterium]
LGTAGLKGNSSQKIYLSPYEFPNGGNVKLRICITGWFSEKPYDIWTQPFKVKNLPGYHHERLDENSRLIVVPNPEP